MTGRTARRARSFRPTTAARLLTAVAAVALAAGCLATGSPVSAASGARSSSTPTDTPTRSSTDARDPDPMSAALDPEEAGVVAAYRDMYRGMLERDTGLLDSLLADDYTLTHMTGYRQSRAEWLQQVANGQMTYHSSQERNTSVTLDGDTAVLVGRNRVDARIWGSRGTWNLQLTTEYERRAGTWLAVRTVATTF